MRPLLVHASSSCSKPEPRRVIHLEFASDELPDGLEWHDGGKVTAVLTVGRSGDLEHARRMIKDRATPPAEQLADPDTDLAGL